MHVSPIYSTAFPASSAQHFSSLRARPLPIPSATPAAPLRRPACCNGKVEKRAFSHATSTISHIFAHLSDGGLAKLITPPSLLPLTNSNRQGLGLLYTPRQTKQFRPPKRSFCPSRKAILLFCHKFHSTKDILFTMRKTRQERQNVRFYHNFNNNRSLFTQRVHEWVFEHSV